MLNVIIHYHQHDPQYNLIYQKTVGYKCYIITIVAKWNGLNLKPSAFGAG
jgi:hypothetical protein